MGPPEPLPIPPATWAEPGLPSTTSLSPLPPGGGRETAPRLQLPEKDGLQGVSPLPAPRWPSASRLPTPLGHGRVRALDPFSIRSPVGVAPPYRLGEEVVAQRHHPAFQGAPSSTLLSGAGGLGFISWLAYFPFFISERNLATFSYCQHL